MGNGGVRNWTLLFFNLFVQNVVICHMFLYNVGSKGIFDIEEKDKIGEQR